MPLPMTRATSRSSVEQVEEASNNIFRTIAEVDSYLLATSGPFYLPVTVHTKYMGISKG
jgi:hypothetical protein